MDFFTSIAEVPEGFGPSAVTIGKFDGVHLGHREVIRRLEDAARDRDLVSTVVTFDRHPLAIVRPDAVPQPLTSNRQKREFLEDTGVEATLMLTFDARLQALTPEEFVDRILVETLQAEVVLVGTDFRFGVRGSGNIDTLRELGRARGFDVRIIPDVQIGVDDDSERDDTARDDTAHDDTAHDDGAPGDHPERDDVPRRVSSSWIRELLDRGDIDEATLLLGRAPSMRGVVVHGEQRGRQMGFPTANLEPHSEGFVPADGIYAGRVLIDGTLYDAAISVGNNPTFEGVPEKQVEAHLIDVALDVYGKEVTVFFLKYLRGNVKYEGMEALVAQISRDVDEIRGILEQTPGGRRKAPFTARA